jgi:hypothetical protein
VRNLIVICAASVCLAGPAAAQEASNYNWMQPQQGPESNGIRMRYMTGNDFLTQCRNTRVACSTYIQGVNDAMLSLTSGTDRDLPYCIPNGSTIDQVTDVVLAFLQAHPEHRHRLAPEIIAAALEAVWPQCRVGA